MDRKVWITGLALVVVGVVVMVLLAQPPLTPRLTPLDELTAYLLRLVPLLGLVCVTIGAVMLALAVAAGLTGRPLVTVHPAPLLVLGLGGVVLAEVLNVAVGSLATSGPSVNLLLVLSHAGGVLQMVGASLVAIWLTGRIEGAPAPGTSAAEPVVRSASS